MIQTAELKIVQVRHNYVFNVLGDRRARVLPDGYKPRKDSLEMTLSAQKPISVIGRY